MKASLFWYAKVLHGLPYVRFVYRFVLLHTVRCWHRSLVFFLLPFNVHLSRLDREILKQQSTDCLCPTCTYIVLICCALLDVDTLLCLRRVCCDDLHWFAKKNNDFDWMCTYVNSTHALWVIKQWKWNDFVAEWIQGKEDHKK